MAYLRKITKMAGIYSLVEFYEYLYNLIKRKYVRVLSRKYDNKVRIVGNTSRYLLITFNNKPRGSHNANRSIIPESPISRFKITKQKLHTGCNKKGSSI